MITREMLIDAIGRLMADVTDGTWGLSDDCMHPAIVELYDHLPAVPEPGATRPLHVVGVEPEDLGAWIGYRFFAYVPTETGNRNALVTIASVRQNGTTTEVAIAEFPGYHVTRRTALTDLWAPVWDVAKPVEPTEPDNDAHPDLIDRDGDTWRWYKGYAYDTPALYSREAIESDCGPVRDA